MALPGVPSKTVTSSLAATKVKASCDVWLLSMQVTRVHRVTRALKATREHRAHRALEVVHRAQQVRAKIVPDMTSAEQHPKPVQPPTECVTAAAGSIACLAA
jgi:hypothetical protein